MIESFLNFGLIMLGFLVGPFFIRAGIEISWFFFGETY